MGHFGMMGGAFRRAEYPWRRVQFGRIDAVCVESQVI